jgi:protein TonB
MHLHKNKIMNKDIILQSNLLDIVFDNRNKDYGAYILRKEYNSRMRIAIFGMISISAIFCFILLSFNSTSIIKPPIINIADPIVSPYHPVQIPANKSVVKATINKKISSTILPPKIANNINILPATPQIIQPSLTGNSNSAMVPPLGLGSSGSGSGGGLQVSTLLPVLSKPDKKVVLDGADVMPQYPGGIKALLEFLKKNIHSPEDVEDDVAVKIKFVVNYNGQLESFNVIQSGGEVFDNEVVRVLKKMPLWIPGKNNGENVSVYYVVPVKFTKEF